MKLVYTLLVAALLLLWGCKQDLHVAVNKYVDTPVIYGLLSVRENYPSPNTVNTHFIRIQKGYLLNGNAYTATGIIDSIYYPNDLKVQLASSNGITVFNLTRVDGATVGLNKDTGIFANVPNYLYTFNGVLDSTRSYTLIVTRNSGADTVATATTALVNNWQIYSPSNLGASVFQLENSQPGTVAWAIPQNSNVFDLYINFYYKEFVAATNQQTKDTFVSIPVFTSYSPTGTTTNNTLTYNVPASLILGYLANHISTDASVYRTFTKMQFTFAAGGTALGNYFQAQQLETGLASSDALPTYTNVNNGVGLLSSRAYLKVDNIYLNNGGLDTLACDPTASFLNFKNSSGNICH